MSKIRFGYSDDFTAKNSSVGINTTEPQENLDVAGIIKGQNIKATGVSSITGYDGFLRGDHQIAEDTTLEFTHGASSSLSGEIIVETGKTVTVNDVKETVEVGNNGGKLWYNLVPGGHSGIIDRSPADRGAFWNGEYFDLDGSNDVITGESCLTLFKDDTDHTIEMWVKFDDVTTRGTIISGYKSGDADRWDLEINGGKLKGGHHGTGYFTSTASVITGKWYHLVYVHDHASSLWRVFIDTATDVTQSNGGADLTSNIALSIGDRGESSIGHLNGQISIVRIYNRELTSTEISTNYNLGQFAKETSVTDGLITHYNASNPSSYPGTVDSVDTTSSTRGGGSEIECLKVYNTFTPPSGGINERPTAPKPGQLYYNYDLKTIEFHDGYGWRQVDYTTRMGRGVFAGGYITGAVRTKDIESIQITTLGNSVNFGDLARNLGTDSQGFSNGTRGVFCGGYGVQTPGGSTGRLDDIDYITIASEGNAADFGNLQHGRNGFAASSSSTRGLVFGGATNLSPGTTHTTNHIDFVEISTLGNAEDFGDLFKERMCSGAASNGVRALIGSGDDYAPGWQGTALAEIDSINFSSKGGSSDFFGTDCIARLTGNTAANGIRALWAGGYTSPLFSSGSDRHFAATAMSSLSMSSGGNAVNFGRLSMGFRTYIGATETKTRGIWTGGSQYPTMCREIDYVQFASLGDSIDFGDLHRAKGYMTSGTSDSNGGLSGI